MLERLLAQRVLQQQACSTSYSLASAASVATASLTTGASPWGLPWRGSRLASSSAPEQPAGESPGAPPDGPRPARASLEQQHAAPRSRRAQPQREETLVEQLRRASPTGKLLDVFSGALAQPAAGADPAPPAAAGEGGAATGQAAAAPARRAGPAVHDVAQVILQAVENCKPLMKVQATKAGTKVVHVPRPIRPAQSTNFAVKWILQAAAKRQEGSKAKAHECLALELLLAYQKKGGARSKRDELHKLALDNRGNVRVKWW